MSAGSVTLGIAQSESADGWTTIVPRYNVSNPTDVSTNSNLIYVSSSTGVDAPTGGTLAAPLATVEYAYLHATVGTLGVGLRSGFPDWLLLKKGDTWTDSVFTPTSGASFQEPQVIIGYTTTGVTATTPQGTGTGSRPLIKCHGATATKPVTHYNASETDYVAIIGIEFYCFDRDPGNVGYVATVGSATSCNLSGNSLTLGGTVTGSFTVGTRLTNSTIGVGTYPTVTAITSGDGKSSGSVLQLDATYTSVTGGSFSAYWEPTCISFATTLGFLIEDCKITYYNGAISFQPTAISPLVQNTYIRRNVIAQQYGFNALGLFADAPQSMVIEDNYFDYNGYNDTIGGFFSKANNNFNHGLYINGQLSNGSYGVSAGFGFPVTMTGNHISRDVARGHLRSGGYLTDNLWAANVGGADIGLYWGGYKNFILGDVYTEFATGSGTGNLENGIGSATEGSYDNSSSPTTRSNYCAGNIDVSYCIWSNGQQSGVTNGYCFIVDGPGSISDPPGEFGQANVINCIAYNWPTGNGSGGTGQDASLIFRVNTPALNGLFPPGNATVPLRPNGNGNRVCVTTAAMTGGYDDFGGAGDLNNYPYPSTATLAGYAQSLGYADLNAYCVACQGQSKDSWNVSLMPGGAIAYIRKGFALAIPRGGHGLGKF